MNETQKLERLLGAGRDVRLGKRDAHEVLQKLRARGGGSDAADRLAARLEEADEVFLRRGEAEQLLEELRASGRRWVFGTDAPRERPPGPERRPDPEPDRGWRRFWRT
ncbi:MAG: hypothetical protein WBB76_04295 [Gaiellaceae bacterium]